MPNWRDELNEAVKTKAEREAEEAARQKQRVLEALASAEGAMALAIDAMRFGHQRIEEKQKETSLAIEEEEVEADGEKSKKVKSGKLSIGQLGLNVELDRTTAIIKVSFVEGKPREFDFARDRHIAAADVEEYVGRRIVEVVRSAQKAAPW